MKLVDLAKISRLDALIRRKATGDPKELADKLEISRSSLFELISYLKEEMRAPIIYNRNRPSYVYEYTPRFCLDFKNERMNTAETTDMYLGKSDNNGKKTISCNKLKIEIEIDDGEYYFDDDDIDFTNLYH